MMKDKGRLAEERSSGDSFLRDAHVVIGVPIVSAVICTGAIALCVVIIKRRRDMGREEWKFAQSASQHTWLSSEDGHSGKMDGLGGRGNVSVYATLNSAKPIPMEIRDSTVRFQTFGQRDNFEAPPIPTPNYKKYRRKSGPISASPPDGMSLEVSCISSQNEYTATVEPPRKYCYYEDNSDSDETEDSLYPDYARPYQPAYRQGDVKPGKRETGKHTGGRNKKPMTRSRGNSREYLE